HDLGAEVVDVVLRAVPRAVRLVPRQESRVAVASRGAAGKAAVAGGVRVVATTLIPDDMCGAGLVDEDVRERAGARELDYRPLRAIAPVLVRQLPALQRLAPATLEAPQLLLVRDVHPELDQDRALRGERALEADDLVVGPAPLLLGREALHALDQHAAVPGAV